MIQSHTLLLLKMACRERVDVVVVVSSRAEVYVVEKVKDRWTGK